MAQGAIVHQPVALGPPGFHHANISGSQYIMTPLTPYPLGSPSGLEYLLAVCELRVKQKYEFLEVLCGCEAKNKYELYTPEGIPVYSAVEESNCISRQCLGPLRPFELILCDVNGVVAIQLSRPFSCQGFCCPCCLQSISVYSPPGVLVGTVEEIGNNCSPELIVRNSIGEIIFKIEGPACTTSLTCSNVEFPVKSASTGLEIGRITKQWTGCGREAFTDSDTFRVSFPIDLEVGMKGTLIGALFLIIREIPEVHSRFYLTDENRTIVSKLDSNQRIVGCQNKDPKLLIFQMNLCVLGFHVLRTKPKSILT